MLWSTMHLHESLKASAGDQEEYMGDKDSPQQMEYFNFIISITTLKMDSNIDCHPVTK